MVIFTVYKGRVSRDAQQLERGGGGLCLGLKSLMGKGKGNNDRRILTQLNQIHRRA